MGVSSTRITMTVARVLREFLTDPTEQRYGFDLMRSTGLSSGALYVTLAKLEHDGWLVSDLEDIDPSLVGRPARRLYWLTAPGVSTARLELAALSEKLRPPPWPSRQQPRLQGGQV